MNRRFSKFSALCLVLVLVFSFASCSGKKEKSSNPDDKDNATNKAYDEVLKDYYEDKPIADDDSVLGEGFTINDFTFTSADNFESFTLANNSFGKMLEGGTFYNLIQGDTEVVTYSPGYKTARGLDLNNTSAQFLEKYGIGSDNAIYYDPLKETSTSGKTSYYSLSGTDFNGKLTVLFASEDSMSYTILDSKNVQKYLSVRDVNSNDAYIDPEDVMNLFPDYTSIAAMNITADSTGNVSEFAIYKYDR